MAGQMDGHGKQLAASISNQERENENIYKRIDIAQEEMRKGVAEIKDSLASRGKISSTQIFALIAVLISGMALFGGIAQAYISVRLDTIKPLIDTNTQGLEAR